MYKRMFRVAAIMISVAAVVGIIYLNRYVSKQNTSTVYSIDDSVYKFEIPSSVQQVAQSDYMWVGTSKSVAELKEASDTIVLGTVLSQQPFKSKAEQESDEVWERVFRSGKENPPPKLLPLQAKIEIKVDKVFKGRPEKRINLHYDGYKTDTIVRTSEYLPPLDNGGQYLLFLNKKMTDDGEFYFVTEGYKGILKVVDGKLQRLSSWNKVFDEWLGKTNIDLEEELK